MTGSSPATSWPDGGPVVSVAWLMTQRDQPGAAPRLIDVRPAEAYTQGHIPGAVHLDLYQPALKLRDSSEPERQRFLAATTAALRVAGVRQGERVIFYEEITGSLAARGVWLLDYLGHDGGAMLDGGLAAWERAEGEVSVDRPAVTPGDLTPVPRAELLATADELLAVASEGPPNPSDTSLLILDTRAAQEHALGTIPGAIHIDWTEHLQPDGTLRPPAELQQRYAAAGVSLDGPPIATFCGSGFRAAHTYVVLRSLGYSQVANYSPSWGEWSRRRDLPVARPMSR